MSVCQEEHLARPLERCRVHCSYCHTIILRHYSVLGRTITVVDLEVLAINIFNVMCALDAVMMTEMRMEDLMEMKSYTKLIAKQSKQLESLRRKHEKVC